VDEIVKLISVLAWPVLIGLALCGFRVPISTFITSLSHLLSKRTLKAGPFEVSDPAQQIASEASASSQGLPSKGSTKADDDGSDYGGIANHFAAPVRDYVDKIEDILYDALPHLEKQFNIDRQKAILYAAVDHMAALRLERISRAIFGSQLEALGLVVTFGDRLPRETLRPIYTKATTDYPAMYTNYIFEQWLAFLVNCDLIKLDNEDVVVTPAGKTIIPYMDGWGYLRVRPAG
jgi:hypothetical protein